MPQLDHASIEFATATKRAARHVLVALLAVMATVSAGCGANTNAPPSATPVDAAATNGPPGAISDAASLDLGAGACAVEITQPADEGATHVDVCSPVTFRSRPPASGNHYPTWPVFRMYEQPVPWGFLVHGLEHGAVVIAHNCPSGCASEIAAAKALVARIPNKAGCARPPVIMTPDPTLDVPWALSAWGYVLRARCFDEARFAAFIAARANQGPEYFPTDCGATDREATGWCPSP